MSDAVHILTVTLNPALDKMITLPALTRGEVNRAQSVRVDPGGKGINVARALTLWGGDSLAAGWIGKQDRGTLISRLQDRGIPASFVEVEGETRTNLKIMESKAGRVTDLNEPGFTVGASEMDRLMEQYRSWLKMTSWVVLSGSLPPGSPSDWYYHLIREARSRDKPVVLDTSGEALQEGLKAVPTVVKPNRDELEGWLGKPIRGDDDLLEAACGWLRKGVEWVVVSLGADGAWFVTEEGIYRSRPPAVADAHPVGAGDAMVAGLVWGLSRSMSPEEIARWATAAGALAASKPGTQFGTFEEVNRWVKRVALQRWDR
ncbi:1-phosphofructokinase [Desmospora profundinema]|uniref:Tagatose-6-phosphate kinase n=1 Tax=Desmospora profundinema TaxID=1571184 RepID=A0ABU1IMC5_9BACL|nr:1-phosphofructokinase [Desmospora profundinema]MDR6225931.1 1-phosphofructokinase [Desmospora profundinema]